MKFKVGDKVKSKSVHTGLYIGTIIEVNSGITKDMYLCRFPGFNGHYGNGCTNRGKDYSTKDHWYLCASDLELIEIPKTQSIVIYRKDREVIALDENTGKTGIARCCPDDTFDFMTGAKLAFDRLAGADKRFKVGDIVRGKAESGKLYAITTEDMTKAEVVAVSNNGNRIDVKIMDHKNDVYIGGEYYGLNSKYFELVNETTPQVKEVKRYAKPGEYIKIVNPHGCSTEEYKKGDILKVVKYSGARPTPDATYYKDAQFKYANADKYVVLEGYEPPKQDEPTYYNGKIIFTKGDEVFRTGHVYEIKDGQIKHPWTGTLLPNFLRRGYTRLYSIEDVKDYFSANSTLHNGYGWSNKDLELIEVVND